MSLQRNQSARVEEVNRASAPGAPAPCLISSAEGGSGFFGQTDSQTHRRIRPAFETFS